MLQSSRRPTALPVGTACSPAVAAPLERNPVLIALCEALPVVLDGLECYAREAQGPTVALAWSLRQAGLIVLGALEKSTGTPRSIRPKHTLR